MKALARLIAWFDADTEAEILRGEVASLKLVIAHERRNVEQWKHAADVNANAYAEITTSRRAIADQLAASQAEVVSLSNQLATIDRTSDQFAGVWDSAKREVAALKDENKSLRAEMAKQTARIAALTAEAEAAWTAQQMAEGAARQAEASKESTLRDMERVRARCLKLKEERDALADGTEPPATSGEVAA